MIETIPVIINSLKTAIDITKTIKNSTNDKNLKNNANNLVNVIIDLQNQILSVQSEHYALLKEHDKTRKKIIEFETWEQEKINYELIEICTGVFVYSYKKTNKNTEPEHWLCQKCYNNKKKSILQLSKQVVSGNYYICHECNVEICDYSKERPIAEIKPPSYSFQKKNT